MLRSAPSQRQHTSMSTPMPVDACRRSPGHAHLSTLTLMLTLLTLLHLSPCAPHQTMAWHGTPAAAGLLQNARQQRCTPRHSHTGKMVVAARPHHGALALPARLPALRSPAAAPSPRASSVRGQAALPCPPQRRCTARLMRSLRGVSPSPFSAALLPCCPAAAPPRVERARATTATTRRRFLHRLGRFTVPVWLLCWRTARMWEPFPHRFDAAPSQRLHNQ